MKEHKLYQCELCNTNYNDKKTCLQCEQSHKTDCKIVNVKYVSYKSDKTGFPQAVELQFPDGTTIWYKR